MIFRFHLNFLHPTNKSSYQGYIPSAFTGIFRFTGKIPDLVPLSCIRTDDRTREDPNAQISDKDNRPLDVFAMYGFYTEP